MKQRMNWVDVAKGIAIVCVVMGHAASSYFSAGLYRDAFLMQFSNQFIYSFHMPLFMFVSGFLFSKSSTHDGKSKIKRILINNLIPYITFSVVWIVFKLLFGSITNSQVSVTDLLLIPIIPVSFMWFIYALMIMELIQLRFQNVSGRVKQMHVFISVVLIIIQSNISEYSFSLLGQTYNFADLVLSDIIRMYFYFLIGFYYGQSVVEWVKRNKRPILAGGGYIPISR